MSHHCTATIGKIRSLPVRTLLLAGAALFVQFIPGAAGVLQYDVTCLGDGQFWRVVTCHLTHWSPNHLFWDVLMFIVLAGLAERRSVAAFWTCIMTSVAAILGVVVFVLTDVQTYRGLSGLDSAFTGLLAVTMFHDRRRAPRTEFLDALPLVLLAGLGFKMTYEAISGAAIFVPSATEIPLPLVHLAGAVCGVLTGLARNR